MNVDNEDVPGGSHLNRLFRIDMNEHIWHLPRVMSTPCHPAARSLALPKLTPRLISSSDIAVGGCDGKEAPYEKDFVMPFMVYQTFE